MTIYRTVNAGGTSGITVTLDAYTAGDVVGGLLEFDISDGSGGGVVNAIRMVDEDSQAEPYSLYVFNDKPTVIANDAAFALTVADMRKLIAVVPIVAGDYVTHSTFDYVHLNLTDSAVLGRPLIFNGNGKLWAYLVAGSTPDYANADTLWIGMDVIQG